MSHYGVLLRGMNLGKRRLKNEELLACFQELGYPDAKAFLASGNVVVQTTQKPQALEKKVEQGLERLLDYPVPTFIRSASELRQIAERNPFGNRGQQRGKVQVAFLADAPSAAQKKQALALDSAADWLALEGRELYWWPQGGISESELDLKALDRLLGTMTIRTQTTIQRLVEKLLP